jgi:acyl carrier protein
MSTCSKPTLTREQVHEVLWNLAAEHLEKAPDQLKPESRVVQDLGADSLEVVELSMELEANLGINIPDDALESPNLTLGDIENVICEKCL